jgi:hypothetical protein
MAHWVAVLVLMVISCARASAQLVEEGPHFNPFQPPVTLAEARRLAEDAGLGAEGAGAAMGLVKGANAVMERVGSRMDRSLERETLEKGGLDGAAYYSRAAERLREHRTIGATLLTDLRQLVPADKEEVWRGFERRRHRRMYLPVTERRGVNVDLISIAESLKLASEPRLREVLGGYEAELDRLLLQRMEVLPAFIRDGAEPPADGGDAERQKMFLPLRDVDCAILTLQRSTAEKISKALPPETSEEFAAAYARSRAMFVRTTRARDRAEKLLQGERLQARAREMLRQSVRRYDLTLAATCGPQMMALEDLDCAATAEEFGRGTWRSPERKRLMDAARALELELYNAVERAASPEELDAIGLEILRDDYPREE